MGLNPDGDMIFATLCTEEITLRTYCRAIVATLSCKLLSKGNWKAIVSTARALQAEAEFSTVLLVAGPTSRLDVKSRVLCEFNVSCESPCQKDHELALLACTKLLINTKEVLDYN